VRRSPHREITAN